MSIVLNGVRLVFVEHVDPTMEQVKKIKPRLGCSVSA